MMKKNMKHIVIRICQRLSVYIPASAAHSTIYAYTHKAINDNSNKTMVTYILVIILSKMDMKINIKKKQNINMKTEIYVCLVIM